MGEHELLSGGQVLWRLGRLVGGFASVSTDSDCLSDMKQVKGPPLTSEMEGMEERAGAEEDWREAAEEELI